MRNHAKKRELIRIYGKKSMYKAARVDEVIKNLFGKSYLEYEESHPFDDEKMQMMKNKLAYHHLQHLSEDGKTDMENGAIITSLEHAFIHTLSRYEEEVVNRELRIYKENYLRWNKEYKSIEDEER